MSGVEHDVQAFLRQDVLRNIVHLKMLQAYPDAIRCFYHEQDASKGALLLLDTSASPFDAKAYPSTQFVVLPVATDRRAAQALLAHVPAEGQLVFKLVDAPTKETVVQLYRVARRTAFLSYTSSGRQYVSWPEVRSSTQVDEAVLRLYAANGYAADEMATYFAHGAFSLAVYEQGNPVSACFCFPNLDAVWEVAGVRTIEPCRRKGYGRKVVTTALSTLLERGYTPRYQMREDNGPSIRLAESIGLKRFLVTEHWVTSHN